MFSFGSSGGPPAATASSSLFPSSSGAASAAPLFANPPGQQQPQVVSAVALSSHPFQYIQQCFDPASPSYRFRFYFYNHVTTGGTEVPAVPEIQKPPSISDKLWAQIQADNPNPQRYVPVIAEGWTALKERSAWQETQSKAQTEKLQELREQARSEIQLLDLDATSFLEDIKARQHMISKRLLRILRVMHAIRGEHAPLYDFTGQIEAIRGRVQHLQQEARSLASITDASNRFGQSVAEAGVVEEGESADRVVSILQTQQDELAGLVEAVRADTHVIESLRHAYEQLKQ